MKLLLATCAKIPPEAIGCDLALKKALEHRGVETVLRPWDQINPQEEAKGRPWSPRLRADRRHPAR